MQNKNNFPGTWALLETGCPTGGILLSNLFSSSNYPFDNILVCWLVVCLVEFYDNTTHAHSSVLQPSLKSCIAWCSFNTSPRGISIPYHNRITTLCITTLWKLQMNGLLSYLNLVQSLFSKFISLVYWNNWNWFWKFKIPVIYMIILSLLLYT